MLEFISIKHWNLWKLDIIDRKFYTKIQLEITNVKQSSI